MKKRCIIYTRVSTNGQAELEYGSCEAQKDNRISGHVPNLTQPTRNSVRVPGLLSALTLAFTALTTSAERRAATKASRPRAGPRPSGQNKGKSVKSPVPVSLPIFRLETRVRGASTRRRAV